jgi:hypothetical protein
MGEEDFQQWLLNNRQHIMLFDGVEKGKPWVVGARGIIIDPNGNQETSFTWGIGIVMNNASKMLTLSQG